MTELSQKIESEPGVQLFILSRDRLDFCRETVASAVSQTYPNCQVIVSDNSEKDDVSEMLAKEFPTVTVIRRKPCLPALEHFNKLIEEAVSPLMVLFHDDDVLAPHYVSRMVDLICLHPEVAAIGCNAHIIRGNKLTKYPFMGDFKGIRLLREPIDLLEPYLSLSLTSPAPFPGYMYCTTAIKGLSLDFSKGGKHADVSFLTSILGRAPMLWSAECLFSYRFHGNNDSNIESVPNRLSWLRYIYSEYGISPKSKYVKDYKFQYLIRWLVKNDYKMLSVWGCNKKAIILRYILFYFIRLSFTRLDFWKRLMRYVNSKKRIG